MRIQTLKGGALCAVVAALLSTGGAFADEKAHDFYFQQQQRRFPGANPNQPQNARTLGASGANLWSRQDALSTVNNPAGLGMMKYGDISLNYSYNEVSGNEYPAGGAINDHENIGSVFGATPLGPVKDSLPDYGNLGIGWQGRSGEWAKDSQNTDDDGYLLSLGYGKALSSDFALGYSLTYGNDSVSSNLYDYSTSNHFMHTVGAQYRATKDLTWGSTLTFSHGTEKTDLTNGRSVANTDQFAFGMGTGVSYQMDKTLLSGGIDYTYYSNDGSNDVHDPRIPFSGTSNGNSMNVRLGVEQAITDMFTLRGGYRYASNFDWSYTREDLNDLNGSAKFNAWSVGAGVNWPLSDASFIRAVQLDYGAEYRDVGDGDWQQLVSLSTPFDLCR